MSLAVSLETLLAQKFLVRRLRGGSSRHYARQILKGAHRSKLHGSGLELDETRQYQAGDDVRQMDWRISARLGKPYVRLVTEEKRKNIRICVDLRSSMYWATQGQLKSALALETAALLGWWHLSEGDRVGATVLTDKGVLQFQASARTPDWVRVLTEMVEVQPRAVGKQISLNVAAVTVEQGELRQGDRGYWLSSVADCPHDWMPRGDWVLLPISDEFERGWDGVTSLSLSDGQSQLSLSGEALKKMSERQSELHAMQQADWMRWGQKLNANVWPMMTQISALEQLQGWLR